MKLREVTTINWPRASSSTHCLDLHIIAKQGIAQGQTLEVFKRQPRGVAQPAAAVKRRTAKFVGIGEFIDPSRILVMPGAMFTSLGSKGQS